MRKTVMLVIVIMTMISSCQLNDDQLSSIISMPSVNILVRDCKKPIKIRKEVHDSLNTMLIYFDPGCDNCRNEAEQIQLNQYLPSTRIYFISVRPLTEVYKYDLYKTLEKLNNLKIGYDIDDSFGRIFRAKNVPFLVIYDRDYKLKKIITGFIPSSELKFELNK